MSDKIAKYVHVKMDMGIELLHSGNPFWVPGLNIRQAQIARPSWGHIVGGLDGQDTYQGVAEEYHFTTKMLPRVTASSLFTNIE